MTIEQIPFAVVPNSRRTPSRRGPRQSPYAALFNAMAGGATVEVRDLSRSAITSLRVKATRKGYYMRQRQQSSGTIVLWLESHPKVEKGSAK